MYNIIFKISVRFKYLYVCMYDSRVLYISTKQKGQILIIISMSQFGIDNKIQSVNKYCTTYNTHNSRLWLIASYVIQATFQHDVTVNKCYAVIIKY